MTEEILNNTETITEILPPKEESPRHLPIGGGMKFIFYMLSFLILPGIIFGAAFYSKDDEEYRRVGKNCIYISLFPLIFYLFIIIIAVFSGLTGDIFGDSIRDIPY